MNVKWMRSINLKCKYNEEKWHVLWKVNCVKINKKIKTFKVNCMKLIKSIFF
jgi:hypothetical protein